MTAFLFSPLVHVLKPMAWAAGFEGLPVLLNVCEHGSSDTWLRWLPRAQFIPARIIISMGGGPLCVVEGALKNIRTKAAGGDVAAELFITASGVDVCEN